MSEKNVDNPIPIVNMKGVSFMHKNYSKIKIYLSVIVIFLSICSFILAIPYNAFADSNLSCAIENEEVFLNEETELLFAEIEKYMITYDYGKRNFDMASALNNNASKKALEIGFAINQMVEDLEEERLNEGGIIPFSQGWNGGLSYGYYCGPGNQGWDKNPIDNLDSACRRHDRCYNDDPLGYGHFACDGDFCRELKPIINNSSGQKYVYASAAFLVFACKQAHGV